MALLPDTNHDFPRCWTISRYVGLLIHRLMGWRPEGDLPNTSKAILIAAPHTSNWDFFHALMSGWVYGVSFSWLGKDTLFDGPLGPLLRFLGGIPVDRKAAHGLVTEVARRFAESERLLLMVPAEGTRSFRDYWKSGFYWMAKESEVPVILGFLDYARRRGGFGPVMRPSGDLTSDMDEVRAFYSGRQGRYPENFSTIRLHGEEGEHEA